MTRRAEGLTLIELLISIGLGMVLVAMGSSVLVTVTRIAKREAAMAQAHDDAGMIHRRLQRCFAGLYHPAQMRVVADPGADGWGSGDEEISLIWMSAVGDREGRGLNYAPALSHDLVWNQLTWTAHGSGRGELRFASSSAERGIEHGFRHGSPGRTYATTITTTPQPRRDRRRDLDDNDLRHLPGVTPGVYRSLGMPGDGTDLRAQLLPFHPPTTVVTRCTFEWVDAAGYVVRCDPGSGITITDRVGDPVATLGTAWSNGEVHVIDGTWLDGCAHLGSGTTPVDPRLPMAQRPLLIRMECEFVPTSASGLDLEQEIHVPYTFSFAAAAELPPL